MTSLAADDAIAPLFCHDERRGTWLEELKDEQ